MAILAVVAVPALGGMAYVGYAMGRRSEANVSSAALANASCFWCWAALTYGGTEGPGQKRSFEVFFERTMYNSAMALAAHVRDDPSCDQAWPNILRRVREYIGSHPEPKPMPATAGVDLAGLDSALAAAVESWQKANPRSQLAQKSPELPP